jgi:hypothetical protein
MNSNVENVVLNFLNFSLYYNLGLSNCKAGIRIKYIFFHEYYTVVSYSLSTLKVPLNMFNFSLYDCSSPTDHWLLRLLDPSLRSLR